MNDAGLLVSYGYSGEKLITHPPETGRFGPRILRVFFSRTRLGYKRRDILSICLFGIYGTKWTGRRKKHSVLITSKRRKRVSPRLQLVLRLVAG
jgi:hypothetical protein